jgi:hypothetical protein
MEELTDSRSRVRHLPTVREQDPLRLEVDHPLKRPPIERRVGREGRWPEYERTFEAANEVADQQDRGFLV